jgi:Na+(H+)/acetate symporter ActP
MLAFFIAYFLAVSGVLALLPPRDVTWRVALAFAVIVDGFVPYGLWHIASPLVS